MRGPSADDQAEVERILGGMYQLVDDFFVEVDRFFEDWKVRLVWNRSNHGRAFALAALGHQCNYLEILKELSQGDVNPYLSSLVKRHCDEAWATSVCLMLGDESDAKNFFGNAARNEKFQLGQRRKLIEEGRLPSDWGDPTPQFENIDDGHWKFEPVFARAGELLREEEVLTGGENLYDTVYRLLSNQLGAHPTPYVFDPYITRGALYIHVSRTPNLEGLGPYVLQLSSLNFVTTFVMTIICALAAAKRLDVDPNPLGSILVRFEKLRMELSPYVAH